jgi:tyrosine-protein phosphatase YwqE
MNVHGALDDRVRRLCIQSIQQSVNRFIASDAKNRSAQNLFRFRIAADFDETLE